MRWSTIVIVSRVDIELLEAPENDLNRQQIRNQAPTLTVKLL